MMSCKASIKANRHLRNDEIQALLDELRRTTDPFTCPHGRPIIISYSIYEMEKMFKSDHVIINTGEPLFTRTLQCYFY